MNKRLTFAFGLALAFAACSGDDDHSMTPNVPDTPETPQSRYVKLSLGSADESGATRAVWIDKAGSGSLTFNWEKDADGKELVVVLAGEGKHIGSYTSESPADGETLQYHSYMTIAPRTDAHAAGFESLRYYNKEEKEAATYVHAVTPVTATLGNTVASAENTFSATMNMPDTFTQSASKEPDFLSDYMMMYGSAAMTEGNANISFKHIPTTFRFIITNKRPTDAVIRSVNITVDGITPVGSSAVTLAAVPGDATLSMSLSGGHPAITTLLTESGTLVNADSTYTAYALALPLASNTAFSGKELQFSITATDPDNEHLAFTLDAEKLATANTSYGEGIYNWVGGKSYTIRMNPHEPF